MTEITCRDVVESLVDYQSHELDPARRHAFEAHLAVCDDCVAYIRSYEQTVRLSKAALPRPEEPADDQLPKKLIQAILAARRRAT